MITVANQPNWQNPTGDERMGDPTPWPGDPRLMVMQYPYYPGAPVAYACWPVGATGWQTTADINNADAHFQLSKSINSIEAERNGVLTWTVTGDGLF